MNIKADIQALAKEIGISKIGFTTADDFSYLEKSLRLGVEEGRTTGFEHKVIEEELSQNYRWLLPKPLFPLPLLIPINYLYNLQKQVINGEKSPLILGG